MFFSATAFAARKQCPGLLTRSVRPREVEVCSESLLSGENKETLMQRTHNYSPGKRVHSISAQQE